MLAIVAAGCKHNQDTFEVKDVATTRGGSIIYIWSDNWDVVGINNAVVSLADCGSGTISGGTGNLRGNPNCRVIRRLPALTTFNRIKDLYRAEIGTVTSAASDDINS